MLLSQMIEENYLNEERFAIAFVGGRFRIKKWGRVKIRYELKQKRISDYCIKIGLASIAEEDYIKTLQKLFPVLSPSGGFPSRKNWKYALGVMLVPVSFLIE